MSERVQVIQHKGHSVVLVDLANQDDATIVATMQAITETCVKNDVRLIVQDVSGTFLNKPIKAAAAKSITEVTEKVGKPISALIGITGIQRIIANAIARGQYFAPSLESALDWVVKKAEAEKK